MHDLKEAVAYGYDANVIVYDYEAACQELTFEIIPIIKGWVKDCYDSKYKLEKIYVSELALFKLEQKLLPMPQSKVKTKLRNLLKTFEASDEFGLDGPLNKFFVDELGAVLPAGDLEIGLAMLALKKPVEGEPLYKPTIVSY